MNYNISNINELLNEIIEIKKTLRVSIDLQKINEDVFLKFLLQTKTPQSYGALFEKRFIYRNNLVKNHQKDEIGDFYDINKKRNIEYKVSILKVDKKLINIVQIRPQQNVDYIIHAINNLDEFNPTTEKIFYLTKNDMINECKNMKAGSAHGKREIAKELRLDIIYRSDNWNRWCNNYSSNNYTF
jgi:hypothetical protein